MKNINKYTATAAISAVALSVLSASAFDTLTAQMGPGAKGINVTRLQTFTAANPSIYPEGLVTGFYGSLTQKAVERFQTQYGIVNSGSVASTGFGRVGPSTLTKLNNLMNNGSWGTTPPVSTGADAQAPLFYNVTQSVVSNNQVNFSFNTNEMTLSRIAYSTNLISFNEGDINGNGFGVIGGNTANGSLGVTNNHSISIQNLSPNTTYYYTIIATDVAGNVSVWGVNNTFRTN